MSIVSKIFFFFGNKFKPQGVRKISTIIAVTPGWVLPKKTATTTLFDIQTVGILRAKSEKR